MRPPFFWLIVVMVAVSLVFTVRLIIKAQRRAKLERRERALDQDTVRTPPKIG